MLGKNDYVQQHNLGYSDKEMINELELTNLLTIATNPAFEGCLSQEYMKKLKRVVTRLAEEKIDRTLREMAYEEEYSRSQSKGSR
jgi:hypothetical protein